MGTVCTSYDGSSPCKCCSRQDDPQAFSGPHLDVEKVVDNDGAILLPASAAELQASLRKQESRAKRNAAASKIQGRFRCKLAHSQEISKQDAAPVKMRADMKMRADTVETISTPRSLASCKFKFDERHSTCTSIDRTNSQELSMDAYTVRSVSDCMTDHDESTVFSLSPRFEEAKKKNMKRRRSCVEVTQKTANMPSEALQIVVEKKGQIESVYDLQKSLGSGSYGSVMKAKLKASGASRAVKKISKEAMQGSINQIKREISILKKVDHPYVIKLYEIFETETDILLVMELCGCGTLTGLMKKRRSSTEQQTAEIMRQIISAVFYLHKHFICHRDLKPDNVLLISTHHLTLKIVDFGLSCIFEPGRLMTTRAGSVSFMAPEVLRKRYNHNCDMWSCGVIMYFTICGYLPFIGDTEKEVARLVIRGAVAFETVEWVDVKEHTMAFIGLLLKTNFRARYTAEQALHHDWFSTYNDKMSQVHLRHDLLSNLHGFRKLNRLKRSALIVLASMLKAEDVKEGHNVFVSLDKNGDGSLTISELRKALARQKGIKPINEGNVEGVFQESSLNSREDKLNPVTYSEFLAATFDRKHCITNKLLKAVFSAFDKNCDGSISLSELSEGHLLGHLSLEELAQTYEELDLNGDCNLCLDEFSQMMRK